MYRQPECPTRREQKRSQTRVLRQLIPDAISLPQQHGIHTQDACWSHNNRRLHKRHLNFIGTMFASDVEDVAVPVRFACSSIQEPIRIGRIACM
jgi:hypothetical protein